MRLYLCFFRGKKLLKPVNTSLVISLTLGSFEYIFDSIATILNAVFFCSLFSLSLIDFTSKSANLSKSFFCLLVSSHVPLNIQKAYCKDKSSINLLRYSLFAKYSYKYSPSFLPFFSIFLPSYQVIHNFVAIFFCTCKG